MQTTRNQRLLKILGLSPVLLYAASLSLPVYATITASDMAVTANVNASCTMSVTSLDFGTYDPILANATQDLTASATVSTNCTLGAFVSVKMGNGLHATYSAGRTRALFSGNYSRHMSNVGSDSKLKYELYKNEGHTDVWSEIGGQSVVGTGASDDLTVYGKVFQNQQAAAAGSYSDSVTVTVLF
ncbi:MAG: spore coat U domain-containing protein [Porticoccaceae bacterium]|nr:spore coat U domain-containing protein [Porticoccaceae bacterium]